MKITHVIPFFAPAWGFGGPVRVCFDLSRRLVKKGHRVTVLTTDAYDYPKRINKVCEEIDGIRIIRFRNLSNKLAKSYNLYLPLGFYKYFGKHIKSYDIVHLHAFFTILNIIAATVCLKKKVHYILHLHESPVPQKILGKVWLKKIFNLLAGKKILYGASRILVPTSAEKQVISQNYPDLEKKIGIVPNSIPNTKVIEPDKTELRKKYGFRKEDKIILSLSRLSRIKRIDRALKIFSEIKDPDFKLLIVGPDEGSTRKKLERLCDDLSLQKRVIFRGVTEGKEKDDLYSLSDLYLLLSEYESFSMTCLEALQHNLPLCLSREVGVATDLFNFKCGVYITNPDNASKSAIQLERTYNNRQALAKNCERALKQFDIGAIANQVNSIYSKIISS